jgi:hypothetical protein
MTGKELCRMDGFPDPINSLCLFDSVVETDAGSVTDSANTLLVTDGMSKYVCLHDFSTNDEEADYELDMPEYLKD